MQTSKKRILTIAILPVAVLLLSGCGFNSGAPESSKAPTTVKQSVPAPTTTAPQGVQDPTATVAPLAPLPVDTKQAIDSEIQGIDQELQATDASLSADVTDESLGL